MLRARSAPATIAFIALLLSAAPASAAGPAYLFAWGSMGTAPGQFQFAHGLAVGPDGSVYVGDTLNNRIQQFTAAGAFVRAWADTFPAGVAIDPAGNLLVCSKDIIQRFSATGTLLGQWGGTGSGDGQLQSPLDVATDAAGDVYVADWINRRVEKFTSTGTYLGQWGTYGTGDGQFIEPVSLAVDAAGFVYVADGQQNRVQKFTGSGAFVGAWGAAGTGPGQFNFPSGVTLDAQGFVLVLDAGNGRVQIFRPDGTFVAAFGSTGPGPGEFSNPAALDLDSAGEIYVLDKDNARVEAFAAVATPAVRATWGAVKARWR